ncbi:MAG TPA: homocysteine S-methyltransferase family protein [Vicinamibacteria bacterium]|jgi:S-methylmethionine-dependent homocysteine/selenocysteine methylase|nr:homocysteine S-methyltransferase family protein [Vicinamibacteria bacterium]
MKPHDALRERLGRGETVVMDGGIGSELVKRGIRWRGHGMRTDAPAVQKLHEEYLDAGADVIRTNTFQLNRRIYLNVFRNVDHMRHIGAPGLERRASELTRKAVELARAARDKSGRKEVAVAGVMSPLEHCFRPDLSPSDQAAAKEHREIADLLASAGADLLLLESMNTVREAEIAAEAAAATKLPVWASFVVDEKGQVLSGEPLADAVKAVRRHGVEAVLVNCAPPEDVARAIASLDGAAGKTFGAYAHVGRFDPPSWKFEFFPQFTQTESWTPDRYAQAAGGWRAKGARILGGCCGTSPAHTRALKQSVGRA